MADPSSTTASTVNDRRNSPETQHSDSQPHATHSSPVKPPWPTIDTNKRDEWSAYVYPHVNTEIDANKMLDKLCPIMDRRLAPEPPKMTRTKKNGNSSTYCDYLNHLSATFRNDNPTSPYIIEFLRKESKNPKSHPTRTICRPDIVAVRNYGINIPQIQPDELHWSHLEATGEEDSRKPLPDGEAQAGAYTAYHLQARPDLVSVVGIFVREADFKLFLSDAGRVYHTPALKWSLDTSRQLLYAWIWRLYNPQVDPSITINMTSPSVTFTIKTTDGKKHDQLSVLRAGESIGRRTIVLAKLGSQSNIVIKEQYIEHGRRFREGPILERIHKGGRFPGVVRLDHFEHVKNGDEKISTSYRETGHRRSTTTVTRSKVRLVLKDMGIRLMDAKTPRKLLMDLHDVMEISRILYRRCQTLHRDINPSNLLIDNDTSTSSPEPLRQDLDDMCFSEYLLDGSDVQANSDPKIDLKPRLATRVLVIDFDSAEVRDPNNPALGDPMARTGTPIFMARMVRSNTYPDGKFELPVMPIIASQLRARYESVFPDRVMAFPANKEEDIKIESGRKLARDKFRHRLRYEAESVFWCLLWWCVQAQPAEKLSEEMTDHGYWAALTGKSDMRDNNFITRFPSDCLHSSYSALVPLLDDMRKHLRGDLDFSDGKKGRGDPEYMHEVFQRLFLNFLVTNNASPFLDLEKDDKARNVEGAGMVRAGTTTNSSKRRGRDDDTESSEDESAPNKRQHIEDNGKAPLVYLAIRKPFAG